MSVRLSNCVLVTVCSLAFSFTSPSAAMDEPARKVAVVEFVEIPEQPAVEYDMKIVVELVGMQTVVENDKITIGANMSAKGLAIAMEAALEDYGVTCKADGTKLVISGWKDPKTGKFYPVKRVKFTSKTMPKKLIPNVTNPKLPIA